jgi:hypothetical protein
MKLPKLGKPERYVGLYIFDFGDHVGVGFTAEEVAELLESEKYKHGKVYKIYRAYPDGKLELKGVPSQVFQLEVGMFFYSSELETTRRDFKQLVNLAVRNAPPCRAKVHLAKYRDDKFVVALTNTKPPGLLKAVSKRCRDTMITSRRFSISINYSANPNRLAGAARSYWLA